MSVTNTRSAPEIQAIRGKPEGGQPMTSKFKIKLLLAALAARVGAPPEVCEAIRGNETARYAGERMDALGLGSAFHTALAQKVIQTLRTRYPDQFELQVLVCDFDGRKIAQAEG